MRTAGKMSLSSVCLQFGILLHLQQSVFTNSFSAASIKRYKELLRDLFEEYDTRVNPRLNQSSTVEVNSSFTLTSIVEFDTTAQSIDIMGYLQMTWFDELLRWDPDEYEQTKYIAVTLKDIWCPRIEFEQTRGEKKLQLDRETEDAKVFSNGLVVWTTSEIFNSLCEVNVEYYPFDIQTCHIIYHTGGILDTVLLNGPDFVPNYEFFPSSEWRVLQTTAETRKKGANVVFINITVQRRAGFTVYTMIVPLATLALVNVFTFLVPIDSGEKGSLSITLFLAYGFFATITRDSLPHNSVQVSYYIVYVTTLLIYSVFTVIYVIIEAKVHSGIGSEKCNIFRSKSSLNPSRSQPHTEEEKREVENESITEKCLIWDDVLKKVDMVIFLMSLLAMVIFSLLLWTYVYQKVSFNS